MISGKDFRAILGFGWLALPCCIGLPRHADAQEAHQPASIGLYAKQKNETDSEFAYRIAPPLKPPILKKKTGEPDSIVYGTPTLCHGPVVTKWNKTPGIIVFYEYPLTEVRFEKTYVDHSPDSELEGYMFVPTTRPGEYRRVHIGTILSNGGAPVIESVFFVNADTDPKKELAVLVSWEQTGHDHEGKAYGVYFYDDLASPAQDTLRYLRGISEKVGESWGSVSGIESDAKDNNYSTAADIKAILKKMGF